MELSSPRSMTSHRAVGWLLGALAAAAAGLWWHGPIAQWPGYHDFADARTWWGIANAANVLSNAPFALVGAWGMWRWARVSPPGPSHRAWLCFAAAIAATAFGSAWYHLAPTNASLVLDRLPIAWACAALACALLAERLDARWGAWPVLAGAGLVATTSVLWWWLGERHGAGDLRLYAIVQFLPMLIVLAALLLRWPPTAVRVLTPAAWWVALALFALAKCFELADSAVFEALGFVSGHTLKHMAGALAAGWLLREATRAPAQLR